MRPGLKLSLRAQQRLALLGRLRMAEWIEMPESEFARQIEEIEKDNLFKKLFFGGEGAPRIIRRQRWPCTSLSGSFYDVSEQLVARGEPVDVEKLLGDRSDVLPLIRRLGRPDFERYFLYGDGAESLGEIARRTGVGLPEIQSIHDFLIEVGARAEFHLPSREPELAKSYACIAKVALDSGEPAFEFYSPYWARGAYRIRYDLLEDWKEEGRLSGPERKRLRHLLKKIETINLRQNAVFRILESLAKLQTEFMRTRRADLLRPISLRLLAHRLQISPSTVSRAISNRSIRLPWGKEVPLAALLPGSRRVVRDILSRWLENGMRATDAAFAEKLRKDYGIQLSRRTINAVRHDLLKAKS